MVLLIICLALYFVPTVIAACRGHHNQGAIFALNLLLGWTLIGWVAAFVWSCTAIAGRVKNPPSIWTAEGVAERHHLRKEEERQRQERKREQAKWARLSSEPPPLSKVQPQQRDLVGPIVIGCLAVIACVAAISWLFAPRHITTTVETTSSIRQTAIDSDGGADAGAN